MPRYVWDGGDFVPAEDYYFLKAMRVADKRGLNGNEPMPLPYVRGDLPEYISPVTRKPVDGRAARREDLKRAGCREVDPGEFKPTYHNRDFAKRHGKERQWSGADAQKMWQHERKS